MKKSFIPIVVSIILISLSGCGKDDNTVLSSSTESAIPVVHEEAKVEDNVPVQSELTVEPEDNPEETEETEQKILTFRDVYGEEYQTVIDPEVPSNPYDVSRFVHDGYKLKYDDEGYDCLLGIDVSHHQGDVDWNSIKEQGYDFAFLRIGFRGYGNEGSLNRDKTFEQNYENARAAGLDVGVYFFAQAINEEEAEEEARYVLNILNGRELELPVVYDPESILDDEARTDNVTAEQFTKNTRAFCDAVKNAGYSPMVYSNMLWEAFQLDLAKLSDIPIWYADYEDVPQTPYDFEFWQYSNEGRVSGVSGTADLNIRMRRSE